jgi:hypothetical protein
MTINYIYNETDTKSGDKCPGETLFGYYPK